MAGVFGFAIIVFGSLIGAGFVLSSVSADASVRLGRAA